VFSCSNLNVLGFMLGSLIHFESIFVQVEKLGSGFSRLCVVLQFSKHHILMILSIVHHIFWLHYQKSDSCRCVDLFWIFYPSPLVFMSAFVLVSCVFVIMVL
jgi:hypothetical protein